jgi:flagellar biosynthesis protein FlhG
MAKKPHIIAMCSGKGGTGKSVITANLAAKIASLGKKCLVWDGDSMFPNQHLIFGVEPPYRLSEVYSGQLSLPYVIYKVKDNLDLLADQPSAGQTANYTETPLFGAFEQLPEDMDYDYILIDTAAGAGSMVMQSCYLADTVLMMLTDEPTSLIDAYGLIKLLRFNEMDHKVKVVLNNVIDLEDANEMYYKLSLATRQFLDSEYGFLGYIEYNRAVRKSIINQKLFIETNADSAISDQMDELAEKIITTLL